MRRWEDRKRKKKTHAVQGKDFHALVTFSDMQYWPWPDWERKRVLAHGDSRAVCNGCDSRSWRESQMRYLILSSAVISLAY